MSDRLGDEDLEYDSPGDNQPPRGIPLGTASNRTGSGVMTARGIPLGPRGTFPPYQQARGTTPPSGLQPTGASTSSPGGLRPTNGSGTPQGYQPRDPASMRQNPNSGMGRAAPLPPGVQPQPLTRDPYPMGSAMGTGQPVRGAVPPSNAGGTIGRNNSTAGRAAMLAKNRDSSSPLTPPGPDFNPLGTVVLPKTKRPAQLTNFHPSDIMRDKPKLAKGSFGVIYTGHVRGIKEKVVIKDMTNVYPESVEEWKNEIEVMSNNSCDFVCKIFGHCEDKETLSLIVEYMPKGDLFQILHKNPHLHPLSILQRMRMARQTAYGLTFLHSNGLMHRDMKSLNILVADDYSCKLADFGTAKLVTQAQALNTANVGSPLWMAPEVRNGIYGFPADVYSLGLILYEIFSGKMPLFNPTTMTTTLPAQFSYSKLILPCIDKDPTKRPTSFQIGQMLDTMISSIVMSVLTSMKQPGAKPPVESPTDKLCQACWNNDLATVKATLNAGNINDKNQRGQGPLYCAARQGSVECVLELLNFGGVNVDMQVPEHGGTPLHAACFAEHCQVVALLLAKGAASSIANLKGLSPRQEAKGAVTEVYAIFEKSGMEKLKAAYPVLNKLTNFNPETQIHKPLPHEGVPFPELDDLEGPKRLEVIYKYILSLPPAEAEALINNAFKIQMMK